MEKYFETNRPASRSEYWGVMLITLLADIVLGVSATILSVGSDAGALFGSILILITVVISTWVMVATGMRRCLEADVSKWWSLGFMIPYVGWIVSVVIGCIPPAVNKPNASE